MLPGPAPPGLVALFVLQAFCAIAAAVGVWRRRPWAADAVIALGVAIATTSVIEGFLLRIIPYLRVLAVGMGALTVAFVIAVYLNSVPNPWVTLVVEQAIAFYTFSTPCPFLIAPLSQLITSTQRPSGESPSTSEMPSTESS